MLKELPVGPYTLRSDGLIYGPSKSDPQKLRKVRFSRVLAGLPTIEVNGRDLLVEELVARAFLGAPRGRRLIHLDGDNWNCALENLSYVEDDDAAFNALEKLLQPENHPRHWSKSKIHTVSR